MVNKQDFIAKVAEKSGFTKVDTKTFMNAMEEVIFDCVRAQEDLKMTNGLTITVKDVAARTGRNPMTGETIQIPAKKKVAVKIGKALKEAAN